ncbi:hypothetical protein ASD16_17850 [Cellulomonas sp. Root485]|nr:hypothetical protein ASD16_17850 [Cellulomonas sp. Root485]
MQQAHAPVGERVQTAPELFLTLSAARPRGRALRLLRDRDHETAEARVCVSDTRLAGRAATLELSPR